MIDDNHNCDDNVPPTFKLTRSCKLDWQALLALWRQQKCPAEERPAGQVRSQEQNLLQPVCGASVPPGIDFGY
jgi:hypothetical protein